MSAATVRTVAAIQLVPLGAGLYESKDGLFRFTREDPHRPRRGWYVRALKGDYADPAGQWEPLVLGNGLTHVDTLREAVVHAYQLKWQWLRWGNLTYEQLAERAR